MSLKDIHSTYILPRKCSICKKYNTEFYNVNKPNGKIIKLCTICHLATILIK